MLKDTDIAWLAGFWDGEGSVGLVRNKKTLILQAQLSHTEYGSVIRILRLLKAAGITRRGYTYQERDPKKHRDAHYIRVTSISNVGMLADLLLPHAVTKKRYWQIASKWAKRRTKIAGGTDRFGRLKRGGKNRFGYSEKELALAKELSSLNLRGPEDRARRAEGRIK